MTRRANDEYIKKTYGGRKFKIEAVKEGYLQAVDEKTGKRFGRPFKKNGEAHKNIYKAMPIMFSPQTKYKDFVVHDGKLIKEGRRNITRSYKSKDWQDLGFTTAKQGQEFVRALRATGVNFLSSQEGFKKVAQTFKNFTADEMKNYFINKAQRLKSVLRNRLSSVENVERDTPYGKFLKVHEYTTRGNMANRPNGVYLYYNNLIPILTNQLEQFLATAERGVRFTINSAINLANDLHPLSSIENKVFSSKGMNILKRNYQQTNIKGIVSKLTGDIIRQIENFLNKGSGWRVKAFNKTYLNMTHHTPKAGRKYFEMPEFKKRRSLFVPENDDDYCAWYCCVYALESKNIKSHPKRITTLKKFKNKYPINQKLFPLEVSITSNRHEELEKLFQSRIHIHVSTIQTPTKVECHLCSKSNYENEIDLLLIQDLNTDQRHFALVKDIGVLTKRTNGHKTFFCRNCEYSFSTQVALTNHQNLCLNQRTTEIKMPVELENDICRFKSSNNTQLAPYILVWDSECWFRMDEKLKHTNSTTEIAEHVPSGVYVHVYSTVENKVIKSFYHRGENALEQLMKSIYKYIQDELFEVFDNVEPIRMTRDDWQKYKTSKTCYVCGDNFAGREEMEAFNEKKRDFIINNERLNKMLEDGIDLKSGELKNAYRKEYANFMKSKKEEFKQHYAYLQETDKEAYYQAYKDFQQENEIKCPKFKVKDHDHFTGKFRGASCNECNFNMCVKREIPCIAHNFRGYDCHLLVKSLEKDNPVINKGIDIIPNNTERYTMMTCPVEPSKEYFEKNPQVDVDECLPIQLKFMDSMCHLNSSLDKQVELLEDDDLTTTKEYIRSLSHNDEDFKYKFELCRRKGVYPYEYFDNPDKFNETELPEIKWFVSSLQFHGKTYDQLDEKDKEKIKKKYKRAVEVWVAFECKNLWDYHDLYLKLDVFLLTDVWLKHRQTTHEAFGLDPCFYVSAPHLFWEAMLKKTKVELRLLSDIDMYMFMEKAKIGGVSMVGLKRYSEANHPKLASYDVKKKHKYIIYGDVNALYPNGMISKLPYDCFQWVNINEFNLKQALDDVDGDYGYFLEVDFPIPKELHNQLKDYPILPENISINRDMLSPIQNDTIKQLEAFDEYYESGVSKLVPNLHDKKNYILHIKHLKSALEVCDNFVNLEDIKVHRVMRFKQTEWLKPYIDFCTGMRSQAKNKFYKDYWKLASNSVFGKTMEDTRDRINLFLTSDAKTIQQKMNDIRFSHFEIGENGLVAFHNFKKQTTLNKPIYAGITILNLAKCKMYEIWYGRLKKKYGDKVALLYTDTDSLVFEVETENFEDDVQNDDLWDFSTYPKDHPLHNNNTAVGKFKDETKSVPIHKFIATRAKCYAFTLDKTKVNTTDKKWVDDFNKDFLGCEKCVGKGINKNILKNDMTFDMYERGIFHDGKRENMVQKVNIYSFQTTKHNIKTIKLEKKTISPYDDKRILLKDGITCLPFGHHLIDEMRNGLRDWII